MQPPLASSGRSELLLRQRIKRAAATYGGFTPAAILLGAFFGAPLVLIVLYSFWKVVDYNIVHQWTLDNYRYFFSVPTYIRTFWSTLWMAAAGTALTIAVAFPLAYWLVRHVSPKRQKPLLMLIIVPFWTSYLLRVYAWIAILGQGGAINRALAATGITAHPVGFLLYDRPAVLLVLVYLYFPFAALSLYAVLERFDWDQLRAAMDLGARPVVAVARILLPQVRSGLSTAFIFVFVPMLGEYLTPQLIGGTRGVMIGNLIVNFFNGAQYSRGAAAALLVAAVIVLLLVLFRRSLNVQDQYGR
jgi:ABC-type spermidine/putrescine transport system permease subunit I